jgi:hypothetical protein
VELKRNDIEFIWTKVLNDLFELESRGQKRGVVETEVSGTTKGRPNAETIRNGEIRAFLDSGLLSPSLSSLDLRFSGNYSSVSAVDLSGSSGQEVPKPESRMLSLKLREKERVQVELDGSSEWISRSRGFLDPFLSNKRRNVLRLRASFIIGWTLLPLAALLGLAIRLGMEFDNALLLPFVYLFLSYLVLNETADKVYPRCLIVVEESALHYPWYVGKLGEVWVGVVVSVVAGLVLATVGV